MNNSNGGGNNHLLTLARYDSNKIANNQRALLVLSRCFFTYPNNINDNRIINNFLKHHRCILWSAKSSYNDNDAIQSPYINGQIIGLIDNAKNMTYVRQLVRSEKDVLALPSILIDYNLRKYTHTGFDFTIDLENYITGFVKVLNMTKVIQDIDNYLQMWYNNDFEFTEQITNGIYVRNNSNKLDYKF